MSSFGKIALLIDGSNLYATSKALGFDIDYRRLLSEFQSRGTLLRALYYTTVEDQEFSSIRPLIDWLDYNGYTVVTKLTKEFVDASTGRRKVRGSMDVDLAVSAMELAEHVDQIVLFSGDGNFRSLVESLQRRGVRVTVLSTLSTQPPMIADDLRRQADVFIDLAELKPRVGRNPVDLPASREVRQPPQFLARGTIKRDDRVE
ncbi:LabA-like NYN domain-containing protein [Bradyrhizobium sp. CCBAU 53415]|uniref:LabA-like NYN domain-containing protein n=1 Tax=Bradyrhizobium sp. CCBAU 53415 TaxID=1325119 RepID=UPI002305F50A|nr:NYN domain-containing protein [Bradyrhizobium sp. CCBAU 53415]MDA9467485.1 labA-like protein [Bradyrhizobium sp. CCBAU 53415]